MGMLQAVLEVVRRTAKHLAMEVPGETSAFDYNIAQELSAPESFRRQRKSLPLSVPDIVNLRDSAGVVLGYKRPPTVLVAHRHCVSKKALKVGLLGDEQRKLIV